MTHRTAARVVGILFLTATVPFSLAVILLEPILGAPDYLTQVSADRVRVGTGALLELCNHVSVVGIAVVIYPILRQFSERVALGYVAARSIEAVLFSMGTMDLLALVELSREYAAAGSPAATHFQTLGDLLLAGHDWNKSTLAFTVFGVGALMLNGQLLRARLVPRWLSVLGLAGAASILGARIVQMVGFELSSTAVTALDAPIMLQEVILAVWLLVKGFETRAASTLKGNLVFSTGAGFIEHVQSLTGKSTGTEIVGYGITDIIAVSGTESATAAKWIYTIANPVAKGVRKTIYVQADTTEQIEVRTNSSTTSLFQGSTFNSLLFSTNGASTASPPMVELIGHSTSQWKVLTNLTTAAYGVIAAGATA